MSLYNEVITTKQLQHHRSIGKQTIELRDRWNASLSWYPIEQNRQYEQYNTIYKESLEKYGEKDFLKYAKSRRLRSTHTASIEDPKLESVKTFCCYPMDYMANYKPSVTTNGEYGLVPWAFHYSC